MSNNTVTTWACDRCKRSWSTPKGRHADQPPQPWCSIRSHLPPNHAEPAIRYDLCPLCEHSFADWMHGRPEPKMPHAFGSYADEACDAPGMDYFDHQDCDALAADSDIEQAAGGWEA